MKISTMVYRALRSLRRWVRSKALLLAHYRVAGGEDATRGSAPKRITRVWDRQAEKDFQQDFNRRSWSGIAQIHENHIALITGERGYYWITYVRDHYFPEGKAGDTLSLGCGEGYFDRILKNCGFCFNSFTSVDLSAKSIARAKEEADKISLSPSTPPFYPIWFSQRVY